MCCHAWCRSLFVQLAAGPRDPVDTEAVAAALKLERAVQQDGQEFWKLLLTLLEASSAAPPAPRCAPASRSGAAHS